MSGTAPELSVVLPAALVEAIAARAAELVADKLDRPRRAYLSVDGAANYIACPKSRLYALVSAGQVPHRKDGSRLLFQPDELDAWLERGGGKRP